MVRRPEVGVCVYSILYYTVSMVSSPDVCVWVCVGVYYNTLHCVCALSPKVSV